MPDQVERDKLGKWHENPFLQIKRHSRKRVATFFWADDEGLLGYLHYFHSIILPLIDKGVGYIGETHST